MIVQGMVKCKRTDHYQRKAPSIQQLQLESMVSSVQPGAICRCGLYRVGTAGSASCTCTPVIMQP
jgi:hypothetical protein